MFEYGCPGRANGSADQPEEGVSGTGVAEDRCAFIRALAAVNVARLKGERLMGSAQRVEVRGSGWTRQGEQVTLQAEGMRVRLPPLIKQHRWWWNFIYQNLSPSRWNPALCHINRVTLSNFYQVHPGRLQAFNKTYNTKLFKLLLVISV